MSFLLSKSICLSAILNILTTFVRLVINLLLVANFNFHVTKKRSYRDQVGFCTHLGAAASELEEWNQSKRKLK